MKRLESDSYVYENIIRQVEEESKVGSSQTEKEVTAFRRSLPILLQTGVGAITGAAVGFFFLPSISLVACGVVGGLGLYTASNTIKSFQNAWSSPELLTVDTPVVPTSKQKD